MNRKFPASRVRSLPWSIQYQMLLPLLAIATWIVFRQATHYSAVVTDRLDADESRTPLLITSQLPRNWNELSAGRLQNLVRQYPGWELFMTKGETVLHSTVTLDEWNQRFLEQLPPITYSSSRTRDFVIYDEYDTFWVSPLQTPHWPEEVHLIALHSREFANRADELLETRIEKYGLLIVCGLLALGVWYSRHLGLRIVRIQQQIRKIANGELTSRIIDHRQDEVGDLALAVNSMADDLVEMKSRIQGAERNRLHSQLSSGIAHELRNGIHSARLSLEMFQERCQKKELPVKEAELLTISLEQLLLTESLVRRLLAFGRPQHGTKTPQSLAKLVEELLILIIPMFQHAEVRFDVSIAENLSKIVSSAESMQSALLNLCLNAMEAAGKGGQVQLAVECTGSGVDITVMDNGAGVDASIVDSLFEPFITTKPEGIGLGLVLVKQAVISEGGTVSWTRAGDRTSFILHLPHDSPGRFSPPRLQETAHSSGQISHTIPFE